MNSSFKKRPLHHDFTNGLKNGQIDLNKNKPAPISKTTAVKTLKQHQVPTFCHEPFILSGYRRSTTIKQCVFTLFSLHNETFNIWSHVVAVIAMIAYSSTVFYEDGVIGNPLVYPLMCFAVSVSIAFTSSSVAHTFSCMSWRARHVCFYFDYTSISVFTFTAGLGFISYSRPLKDQTFVLHKHPIVFIGISFLWSTINLILSLLSRHRYRKYRFLLRTGIYLAKYWFDISPILFRCMTSSSSCDPDMLGFFKRHMWMYGISGFVNATRLPECLFPGWFDYLGNSHHIFHVLLTIGNFDALNALLTDMRGRREELLSSDFQPSFVTSIVLLMALIAVNGCILTWFVKNWLTEEEQRGMQRWDQFPVVCQDADQDDDE